MSSRARTAIVAALAAFALSTAVVNSASANWFVNGSELTSSAELVPLPHIHFHFLIHVPIVRILILCGLRIHFIIPRIFPPNKFAANKIEFEECMTGPTTPTQCQLKGGTTTITTGAVLGVATLNRLTIKPETGKLLTEIAFEEGTTCALEGAQPLKGEVVTGLPNGATESVAQENEGLGSLENNSLELGAGNKTIFLFKWLFLLKSGSKWSSR